MSLFAEVLNIVQVNLEPDLPFFWRNPHLLRARPSLRATDEGSQAVYCSMCWFCLRPPSVFPLSSSTILPNCVSGN